jgi:TRAP-type mannitol/chloroaromatic compound transport system permease large subunit
MPLDLLMIAALIGAILLGFPVAFSIAGVPPCSPARRRLSAR